MYDDRSVLRAIDTINDVADGIARDHGPVLAAKVRQAAIILSYFRHSDLYPRSITKELPEAQKTL